MQNYYKFRFIAANYSNLQGLKSVPLGMMLLGTVLWANAQTGRATNLILPYFFTLATVLTTWVIYRYYRTHFGKVESGAQKKAVEWILGIVGGILGLVCFLMDVNFHFPFSLVGLMFAACVVVEYLRMQWYAPGSFLLPLMLVTFGVFLFVSIMPLFGLDHWWLWLGVRAQLFGVLVVDGAGIAIYGLLGHLFFVRQLPKVED